MPYKCVHCSKTYQDGSEEVLNGCSECGRKFFFYIRKEKLAEIEQSKATEEEMAPAEKDQMEKDVREIAGVDDGGGEEVPIFLDFESVKIVGSGKYVLDLGKLFTRERPQVYRLEDGKYIIDLTMGPERVNSE